MYPHLIQDLINCYKRLPGVGEKTAERMALSTVHFEKEVIEYFTKTLSNLSAGIKHCKICDNYSDNEICSICADTNRDGKIICIVEEQKNIFQLEKIGFYNGKYHVLGGLISPLDNINPENLNIQELINRVKKDEIKEIIIAIKSSIEGETTALYLSKIFENKNVIVSKIAHGIPIGADMDYIDSLTLEMALENRKIIEE